MLNGIHTIDCKLNPLAQFVLTTDTIFITGTRSKPVLINTPRPRNVSFAFGSSATLEITSTIVGAVSANTAITDPHGVSASATNLVALGTAVTDTVKIPPGLCVHD